MFWYAGLLSVASTVGATPRVKNGSSSIGPGLPKMNVDSSRVSVAADLERAVLLHGRDQRIIHGLVAHAVRQAIETGVDQRLGVVQIEDMRRDFEAVLMGVGDDGFAEIEGIFFSRPR